MDRKELIVILVLVALVVISATARLSGMTPALFGPRPGSTLSRGRRPQSGRERGEGLGRLIWPPQRQRYLPRGTEAGTLFDAGERLFTEELYEAAMAAYRRFGERFAGQSAAEVASFRIGQCLTLSDRHAAAADHYEAFLRAYPDSALRPVALLWSGIHHGHLGRLDMARARLREVIERHANTPFADGARERLAALDGETPPAPVPAPAPSTDGPEP